MPLQIEQMPPAIADPTRNVGAQVPAQANHTLDPTDWTGLRKQAHRMLDDMLDYIGNIRERPVWQPIPDQVRARFRGALPRLPSDLAAVHEEFLRDVLPFAVGNVHPGFMGWVHGGGTPVGMLAEMLAAGLNANLGGRDQAPVEVERQLLQWIREIFNFPNSASGLFVTGTSMANLIAVVIARDVALGFEVRQRGISTDQSTETKRLIAYASTAVHGCIAKAMDICGIGDDALRLVATDNRHRIDLDALQKSIERDRAAGFTPFLVIGSAGTVDTGAIDDLAALADLCRRENIWFHVDGAYGALAMLAPDLAPRLAGIERADSLAFDFHKWGQVPYDAGYILVRDGRLQKNAFASPAAYLKRVERGLAAGTPWPCDLGPDLSRGFRALKTWFTMKVYGTEALGQVISRTCELAKYLENRIAKTPELELMAPVQLNIVCFRYRAEDSDQVNQEIVINLQETGIVAPSTAMIGGRLAIRAAIINHRTSRTEIDALVSRTLSLGRAHRASSNQYKAAPGTTGSQAHAVLQSQLLILEKRLSSRPGSVALLYLKGVFLTRIDRDPEARATYVELLAVDPSHVGALNNLGSLLFAAGKETEARALFAQAVAANPNDSLSRTNLAYLLVQDKQPEKAREHYQHALKVDPNNQQAHASLALLLAELGNAEQASWHRRAAFQGRCVVPVAYRGKQPPITVLELISARGGDAPLERYLLDRVFQTFRIVTDFYRDGITLPPHQLVINAIGDADVAADALAGAQSLVAQTTAPVINPPSAVLATGRCDITRRLAGVPGVITPKTMILSRELLAAPDAKGTLTRHGFEFPFLLRTPGFHGGDHFLRVETFDELPAALAKLPGRDLIAIQYLDARASDGKTRKYRVMMIDGQLYPLHCAISSNWKIHYFSAEMTDSPKHRIEDGEFLENMAGVLRPRAIAAIESIQRTLGLDYGGIDFGLNQNGEVLLFEANATMVVPAPKADKQWDYRRPAVERIWNAVGKMFMSRAQVSG
jgi:glutamate/tyrosine decarboxylase-like PLP-dependent enzyme/glutathione synthase/RimK-type ligase-like ATP-grasp enzyme